MSDVKKKVFHCPLEVTMSLIGGKWQCVILWHLRRGKLRFNQLQKRLPGVTPKMLTQQLYDLESNDLLIRKVYPVIPPHVEYSLTEFGKTFIPILRTMYHWGKEYSNKYELTVDTSYQEKIIENERLKKEIQ